MSEKRVSEGRLAEMLAEAERLKSLPPAECFPAVAAFLDGLSEQERQALIGALPGDLVAAATAEAQSAMRGTARGQPVSYSSEEYPDRRDAALAVTKAAGCTCEPEITIDGDTVRIKHDPWCVVLRRKDTS